MVFVKVYFLCRKPLSSSTTEIKSYLLTIVEGIFMTHQPFTRQSPQENLTLHHFCLKKLLLFSPSCCTSSQWLVRGIEENSVFNFFSDILLFKPACFITLHLINIWQMSWQTKPNILQKTIFHKLCSKFNKV